MEATKAAAFLQEVLQKTNEKKLKWRETAEPGIFVVAMGGKYAVLLFDYSPDRPPSLQLKEGEEVLLDITAEERSINPKELQRLYDLVEGQVYRADEKMKSVDDAISVLRSL